MGREQCPGKQQVTLCGCVCEDVWGGVWDIGFSYALHLLYLHSHHLYTSATQDRDEIGIGLLYLLVNQSYTGFFMVLWLISGTSIFLNSLQELKVF